MDPRVNLAVEFLANSRDGNHNFVDLARTLHLSVSRLRHLIKAEVGIAPGKYWRRIRMQRARALLESTFLIIKEVPQEAGFHDVTHLLRDFKNEFGVSPMTYRRAKGRHASEQSDNSAILANS